MEIDQRANVQYADGCMCVVRRRCPVTSDDRAEAVDEFAEPLDRDGVVFNKSLRFACAAQRVEQRFSRFAQGPQIGRDCRIVDHTDDRVRCGLFQRCETCVDLGGGDGTLIFDIQNRGRRAIVDWRQMMQQIARTLRVRRGRLQHDIIEQFDGRWIGPNDRSSGGDRGFERVERCDRESRKLRDRMQFQFSLCDDGESAFAAADQAREVEIVRVDARVELLEHQIERVASIASNKLGKTATNLIGMFADKRRDGSGQSPGDGIASSRAGLECASLAGCEDDIDAGEIFTGSAIFDRSRAGRVVSDDAADTRLCDGRGIGSEQQPVVSKSGVQFLKIDPRLDDAPPSRRINRNDSPAHRRKIEHDRFIRTLTREAGSPAAWQHGHLVFSSEAQHRNDIVGIRREHQRRAARPDRSKRPSNRASDCDDRTGPGRAHAIATGLRWNRRPEVGYSQPGRYRISLLLLINATAHAQRSGDLL